MPPLVATLSVVCHLSVIVVTSVVVVVLKVEFGVNEPLERLDLTFTLVKLGKAKIADDPPRPLRSVVVIDRVVATKGRSKDPVVGDDSPLAIPKTILFRRTVCRLSHFS